MLAIASKQKTPYCYEVFVPGAGIEPARDYSHKILSLACLPIPPSRLLYFAIEFVFGLLKTALNDKALF
jgi:hypothetical protein